MINVILILRLPVSCSLLILWLRLNQVLALAAGMDSASFLVGFPSIFLDVEDTKHHHYIVLQANALHPRHSNMPSCPSYAAPGKNQNHRSWGNRHRGDHRHGDGAD